MRTSIKVIATSRDGGKTELVLLEGLSFYHGTALLFRLNGVGPAGVTVDLFSAAQCHLVYEDGVEKYVTVKDEEETVCSGQQLKFTFPDDQVTIEFDFSSAFIAPPKVKKEKKPKKPAAPSKKEKKPKKTVRMAADAKASVSMALWMIVMFSNGRLVNLMCAAGRLIGREMLGAFFPDQMAGISKQMVSIVWAKETCVKVKVETDKFFFAVDRGDGVLDEVYCEGDEFVLRRRHTLLCYGIKRDRDGYCIRILDKTAIMRFKLTTSDKKDDEYDLVELDDHEDRPEMGYDTDIGEDLLREDDNEDVKKTYDGLSAPKMITLNGIIREMLGSQISSNFTEEVPVVRGDGGALDEVPDQSIEKLKNAQATNKKPGDCVKQLDTMINVFSTTNKSIYNAKLQHDRLQNNKNEFLRIARDLEARYKEKHGLDYTFEHIIPTKQPTRRGVPRLDDVTTRFVEEGEYVSDGEDIGDADTDLDELADDELESDNEIIPAEDDEEEEDDDVPIRSKRSLDSAEKPPAPKRSRVRPALASDSE